MTVLELPPTTESVPVARRFLRAELQQVGEDVDVDTAVLLGSELVTNAVLHARTPVTLMVEVRGVVVRVAVRDESPVAPRVHAFSSSAATGRGLRLIEAMAERWGTDAADGGARLCGWRSGLSPRPTGPPSAVTGSPTGPPVSADDAAGVTQVDTNGAATVDVRLLNFPLRVGALATEHYYELLREFALLAAATPPDHEGVPRRLGRLVDRLGRHNQPQSVVEAERAAALARGELARDFVVAVPPTAGAASRELDALLDEADELCRAGELLTVPPPSPPSPSGAGTWARSPGRSRGRSRVRGPARCAEPPTRSRGLPPKRPPPHDRMCAASRSRRGPRAAHPPCRWSLCHVTETSRVPRPGAAPAAAVARHTRVLLVEDDEGDAFLVRELLLDAGSDVQIERVRTVAEAGLVLPGDHDCVLLDLGLPDAQGLDALAAVLSSAPRLAVIVLTGLADEHRGTEAVAAGAQDYLVKGTIDGQLLDPVDPLCGRAQAC